MATADHVPPPSSPEQPPDGRPERLQVVNEVGQTLSLPEGPGEFMQIGRGQRYVFLGLGPRPGEFPGKVRRGRETFFLECPDLEARLPGHPSARIPLGFKRIRPEQITREFARTSTFFWYRPNLKLFPSFWGPIWARCRMLQHDGLPGPSRPEVWLPGTPAGLLRQELAQALAEAGYAPRMVEPQALPAGLFSLLKESRPGLFLSVNFQGLDPLGEGFHVLAEAGVPVAVWCVDNPFHLLSRLRSRFWTACPLFVTDPWFVGPLKEHGAERVSHLPLAASPHMFRAAGLGLPEPAQGLSDQVVFVGRSRFPGKADFFAGAAPDPEREARARLLLAQGARPDYAWWRAELGAEVLWPGHEARRVGLGAENTAEAWRTLCLEQAARPGPGSRAGLTVFGDPRWRELVPGLSGLRPEVDYYGPLPAIYRHAGFNLNVTSLLLPRGLTQRHFDVWAAGGFLLTDDTPGLDLFPADLVREVRFRTAGDIPDLAARLRAAPARREDLRRSFAAHVAAEHTYRHRVAALLAALGLPGGGQGGRA